jgi:biofilm PGA synthesis N-glycosyltransferase PgaC
MDYTNYEVIVVDDKSTDQTLAQLQTIQHDKLHIIALEQNGGKAAALNHARKVAKGEYVLVIDADSVLERQAVRLLATHLQNNPKVGAVTGKPVVRNRSTFLGKLQALEYVVIIDSIKQAQNFLYRKIMSVSGVLVMYRQSALSNIGGFDTTVMTEDIDATWRMYRYGWSVGYQPQARTFILVPETYHGLFRQRKRWAIGGLEVFLKNQQYVRKHARNATRLLLLDMIFSHLWAWLIVTSLLEKLLLILLIQDWQLPGSFLVMYMLMSVILFSTAIKRDHGASYLTIADCLAFPLYMIFYWLVIATTVFSAQYAVVFNKTSQGKWVSPDRGRH